MTHLELKKQRENLLNVGPSFHIYIDFDLIGTLYMFNFVSH